MQTRDDGIDHTSDEALLARTRAGDRNAYGELWRRHSAAALSAARSYLRTAEPEDLVAESFARIYKTIQTGKGPTHAFRPYLYTTIRSLAISWSRQNRTETSDELDLLEDPATTADAADDAFDIGLVADAFLSLPERWQAVLWLSEVERRSMGDIGQRLDVSARAAAVLAFRAREGLRQAWIAAHLAAHPEDSPECRWVLAKLGAQARDKLTGGDRARVEQHVRRCAQCRARVAEASRASSRLLVVLLPFVGGVAGVGAQLRASSASAAEATAASPSEPAAVGRAAAYVVPLVAAIAVFAVAAAVTELPARPPMSASASRHHVALDTPRPSATPLPTVRPTPRSTETAVPPAPTAPARPRPPAPRTPPAQPPAPGTPVAPAAPSPVAPPGIISLPASVTPAQTFTVVLSCASDASVTIAVEGITLSAGTCGGNGRWSASLSLATFPALPPALTLAFAQTTATGATASATAHLTITR